MGTYNMYHHPVASMILGVASILTILCLLAALALSKFPSPQKVVVTSTPLQRNRSNHDLADRQARARLNLEYRAERARVFWLANSNALGTSQYLVRRTWLKNLKVTRIWGGFKLLLGQSHLFNWQRRYRDWICLNLRRHYSTLKLIEEYVEHCWLMK